jgi:glycerol uptake facilitator-like aquaporin
MNSLKVQVITEYLGTAILLAIVTGSGYMGQTLSQGNDAIALLANSIATGAGLYVLINLCGPISGAHFNPVVTLMFTQAERYSFKKIGTFLLAQFAGAISGVIWVHLMFDLPIIQFSNHARAGYGIWFSEFFSTLLLLSVIALGVKFAKDRIPLLVALVVTAGYWFTSSTFFSNPAVTLARAFTDTFVGIAPNDVVGFLASQICAFLVFMGILRVIGKSSDVE